MRSAECGMAGFGIHVQHSVLGTIRPTPDRIRGRSYVRFGLWLSVQEDYGHGRVAQVPMAARGGCGVYLDCIALNFPLCTTDFGHSSRGWSPREGRRGRCGGRVRRAAFDVFPIRGLMIDDMEYDYYTHVVQGIGTISGNDYVRD